MLFMGWGRKGAKRQSKVDKWANTDILISLFLQNIFDSCCQDIRFIRLFKIGLNAPIHNFLLIFLVFYSGKDNYGYIHGVGRHP